MFPVVVYLDFKELCCRAACHASALSSTPARRSGAILPIGIPTAGAEQQERDQKCRRLSLHFNGKPVTAGSFEQEALILSIAATSSAVRLSLRLGESH